MIVLANGCFDVLHVGHVRHLKEAKSMGDLLVVSLTADEHVNKPGRPIHKWDERAEVLRSLRCVDVVIKTRGAVEAIHSVKPDVFVKGIDYSNGVFTEDVEGACKDVGCELRFTTSPKLSSTEIIERMKRG